MKAQVFSHGDRSVGIPGGQGSIDTGIEVDEDEREGHRADIATFFADQWGEPATVLFDDEVFGEFGGIQRKKLPDVPAKEPGQYLITPKNGGKAYSAKTAPDTWELRECDIQWVPEPAQPTQRESVG